MDDSRSNDRSPAARAPGPSSPPPDRLNEVGVLTRREIEARIHAPLLEALGREFGRERVLQIARDVIIRIAQEQGEQLAETVGGRTLGRFAGSLEVWKKESAPSSRAPRLLADRGVPCLPC